MNPVHYLAHRITYEPLDYTNTSEIHYAKTQSGVTSCASSIGGMLLEELTTQSTFVTCIDCLRAPAYSLHMLNDTEL